MDTTINVESIAAALHSGAEIQPLRESLEKIGQAVVKHLLTEEAAARDNAYHRLEAAITDEQTRGLAGNLVDAAFFERTRTIDHAIVLGFALAHTQRNGFLSISEWVQKALEAMSTMANEPRE